MLHRKLKARAAQAGMSLSDYLRAEIERLAALPSMEEMLERLRQLPPIHPRRSPAEIIRAERNRT
jgi:antitoxin FitA